MNTLMTDPVRLPTSGTVMDRQYVSGPLCCCTAVPLLLAAPPCGSGQAQALQLGTHQAAPCQVSAPSHPPPCATACVATRVRAQIVRHLLTDQRDPMSRAPLKPEQLEPMVRAWRGRVQAAGCTYGIAGVVGQMGPAQEITKQESEARRACCGLQHPSGLRPAPVSPMPWHTCPAYLRPLNNGAHPPTRVHTRAAGAQGAHQRVDV